MTTDATAPVAKKQEPQPPRPSKSRRTFLGWPRWFITLFGTDMWERFSFYGMAALLFLYASEPKADGGLGLGNSTAAALFGVYLSTVFMASLPGGWIGDRILGARRAVLYGGITIALGHCFMAVPTVPTFYGGLGLLAVGTGLLKPNLASMLAAFYPRDAHAERDAGFSIFYMSIQISAVVAPLVTGGLGELVNWHLGFGVAALGMAIGVLQYVRGSAHFGDVGNEPTRRAGAAERRRVLRGALVILAVVGLILGADAVAGTLKLRHVLMLAGLFAIGSTIACFTYLLRSREVTTEERGRVKAYIWVFLAAAIFWMIFVQGGSVFSLFAKASTDRTIGDFTIPASWFQSAVPLFMIAVAPVFARLWVRLGDRVGAPAKLACGLGFMGSSLVVMALATVAASGGNDVSPLWLLVAYLLQACGEMSFAPVGMSVTTKVAPATFISQMIGVFWLAAALGAGVGGQAVRFSEDNLPGPGYFLVMAGLAAVVGTALGLASGRLRRGLGV
ncbi:oligopeptide:H+ symporter [Streptomyces sp. NBC_00210]|uniref:peptide MFS transporter n=1 Tax=unclassified Streptomyces TaxID=2593676 RepID=UPI00325332F7